MSVCYWNLVIRYFLTIKTLTQGPGAREATRSPGFTHTDQTVDQAGVEMFLTARLKGTTGVGGVHVAQDVGQGYEGD